MEYTLLMYNICNVQLHYTYINLYIFAFIIFKKLEIYIYYYIYIYFNIYDYKKYLRIYYIIIMKF